MSLVNWRKICFFENKSILIQPHCWHEETVPVQCSFFIDQSNKKMAKLNWHDIILTWHETHAPMQSNIAFHFPLSHFLQPWNCKSSYEKGQIEDLQNWLERPSSENDLNAAQQLKSSISSRDQISTLQIWIRCYLRCWWTHAWKSQSFLHSNDSSVNLRPHFCMSSCSASLAACPHIRSVAAWIIPCH